MRVLYLSRMDDISGRYSFDNVLRQLFHGALAADPELSIVLTVARGLDSTDFEAEVDAPGRIRVVGAVPPKNERHLSYLSTEDLAAEFSQTKTVPYDVVVNGQPGLHALLWNALANRYSQGRYQVSVPIVSHMMWTVTRELMRQTPAFYLGELDLVGESMAAWYGLSLWESEMLRREWIESVREWLSPSAIERVEKMTVAMPNGIDVDGLVDVWEHREMTLADRDPAVFWGGRLTDQKRWLKTAKVLAEIQASGVRVAATTMFGDNAEQVQTWRATGVPLETRVRRHRMYEVMRGCDVVPCLSKVEGYGSAWLEFLAAGMLVVFKRESWVEKLIPSWYPLVVDRDTDVLQMTLAVVRAFKSPEMLDLSRKIRTWVATEHNSAVNSEIFGQHLTREAFRGVAADTRLAKGAIGRLAVGAAEKTYEGVPLTIEQVGDAMTGLSRGGRQFGRKGDMISPMYLRRCLQVAGWRDVGGASQVGMVP